MSELFKELESNDLRVYSEAKQRFFEQFNSVKESWLLNGAYDYYLQSNSTRIMEVLVNITEQHFIFLCDKLIESIKSSKNNVRMQALTLLGFIVRKEPTWLIKITTPQNNLVKELLKLLKTETDVLPLLSALLVIIVLLPIFPAWMGQNHLRDLMEIFSRLAAFNISNPGKVSEDQMVHMQMALFSLFQRLYGMYPCNFISFLRNHYRNKEMSPIFMHTIRPMITTVKMHPLLIMFSIDYEITNERWKKMVPHDVIVECERFNIRTGERCSNDSCVFAATSTFRSRSGTNPPSYETSQLRVLKGTQMMTINTENNFFSPSMLFEIQPVIEMPVATNLPQGSGQGMGTSGAYLSQEGTSPPEAAIEATPETTPIRDLRVTMRQIPQANVARALTSFSSRSRPSSSGLGTPTNSQPSSPMRKDPSPFSFPSLDTRHSSAFGNPKRENYSAQKVQRLLQDRSQQVFEDKKLPVLPSSPLRIIPQGNNGSVPGSPVLIGQRNESPVSQEDEEVLAIVEQASANNRSSLRQCDSVLHDVEGARGTEEDLENCEYEHGSPCTAGGLHMPNSKSVNEFTRRLRYYSQCAAETEKYDRQSTESSPGKPASLTAATVRRANSCPEIKKTVVPIKDNIGIVLPETAEEGAASNGIEENGRRSEQPILVHRDTQTDVLFPMPYEHLFLSIYSSIGNGENVSESPGPTANQAEIIMPDEYEVLDRYFNLAVIADRDSNKTLRDQLQLLHQRLLFEKHQREIASYRYRRLLAEAKHNKTLEEYNSALRDQIQIQQREIESLRLHEMKLKHEKATLEQGKSKVVESLEKDIERLEEEVRILKHKNKNLNLDLEHTVQEREALNKVMQNVEHRIFDTEASAKVASEHMSAAEQAKEEIIVLNRELLLARELQMRYQERFNDLTLMRNVDEEMRRLSVSYKVELKTLQSQLDMKKAHLESYKQRVTELENKIAGFEEEFLNQKRFENQLKEQHDEKLKAIERKYDAQLAINRKMEENIMELWQKVELATKKPYHSPDISSCQEANASNAVGQTQPPTPLSASLASSDGAFMTIDTKDLRNLQQLTERQLPNQHEEPNDLNLPSTSVASKID